MPPLGRRTTARFGTWFRCEIDTLRPSYAGYAPGMELKRRAGRLSVVAFLLLVAACGYEPADGPAGTLGSNGRVGDVLLRNVYLAASGDGGYGPGDDGLVRLWLFNRSAEADALVDVRSAQAESARVGWDRDCDGTYETVPELPIRADGTVPYERPYAVELLDFTGEVRGGTTVPLTFTFKNAGETRLDVLVEAEGDGDVPDPVRCPPTSPSST